MSGPWLAAESGVSVRFFFGDVNMRFTHFLFRRGAVDDAESLSQSSYLYLPACLQRLLSLFGASFAPRVPVYDLKIFSQIFLARCVDWLGMCVDDPIFCATGKRWGRRFTIKPNLRLELLS